MRRPKLFYSLTLSLFFMLACRAVLPSAPATATPTAAGIAIEVTVIYRGNAALPTATTTPLTISATPAESSFDLAELLKRLGIDRFPLPTGLPTAEITPLVEANSTVSPLASDTPLLGVATATPTFALPTLRPTPFIINTPTPTRSIFISTTTYGAIALLAPDNDMSYPSNVGGVEFKWQWSGGCPPPKDNGFQIRIRPAMTGTIPLGVMEAKEGQKDIGCNSETGIYSYHLNNLKGAPGVLEAHVGKFLWDVSYVKLDPFVELTVSGPRIFEITFAYTGPLDPHGADLDCDDFPSWTEAQAIFFAAGGGDPHDLDPDGNGDACDELK